MIINKAKYFLDDKYFQEVIRLSVMYKRQAERCRDNGAYLAGCVMIGAAFEAVLLSFINCYPEEAYASKAAPRKHGKIKPFAEWSLRDLLAVAKERSWLPSGLSPEGDWDTLKAAIGDYGEVLRHIRNLVHPIRYACDFSGKRITNK